MPASYLFLSLLFIQPFISHSSSASLAAHKARSETQIQDDGKAKIWAPEVGSQIQMILTGTPSMDSKKPSVSPNVPVYDLDLFDNSKATIDLLHKLDKKVICYFSAGTAENWRSDYKEFKSADLGAKLPLWQGERYVNVRSENVWKIMRKRLSLAKQKGCDAVDPDNLDVYSNEKGGGFKPAVSEKDAIRYLRRLSTFAHSLGMSIGLKNSPEILAQVSNDVEFAVNEECVLDNSCSKYKDFAGGKGGKPVFHVEYVNWTAALHSMDVNESETQSGLGKNISLEDAAAESSRLAAVNISSRSFPNLKNDALRNKLCLGDISEAKNWGLSTFIKVLSLDGWIMSCDGHVDVTVTVQPKEEVVVMPDIQGDETIVSEDELEKELQGVVFPKRNGSVKDRRPGSRWISEEALRLK